MRLQSTMKMCVWGLIFSATEATTAFAWRLDLNFNGGAPGEVAQGEVGGGAFTTAAGKSYYTTDVSYEGGVAVELNINEGCKCWGTWGGVITHPAYLKKGDELWFRVRTYMPLGFNWDSYGEGGHLKFIRFHTRAPGGVNEGYDDWYINPKAISADISHKFIFEGEQKWATAADKSMFPVLGQWETYEMYVRFDDVSVDMGGAGRVRMWKNGVLLRDITSRKTLLTPDSLSDRTHLFTYWNGGAPQTQKMYVDDIVLTSDRPSSVDAHGNPYVGVGPVRDDADNSAPTAPVLHVE
ncbi:MAG: hypothetical protein CALGDGBN_00691 [Pseudomonadales bacterium]|nr:hypothetical protein [Pseudomonadales bacterium]